MYVKAWLFLIAGIGAASGILVQTRSWRVAALLAIAVWAFCRLYYFLFYVIERYIEADQQSKGREAYRFAGIGSAVRHVLLERRGGLARRRP